MIVKENANNYLFGVFGEFVDGRYTRNIFHRYGTSRQRKLQLFILLLMKTLVPLDILFESRIVAHPAVLACLLGQALLPEIQVCLASLGHRLN